MLDNDVKEIGMRIALLMEATTAEKNEVVANALNEIAAKNGHIIPRLPDKT